jgi:hypothetical protein
MMKKKEEDSHHVPSCASEAERRSPRGLLARYLDAERLLQKYMPR